MVSVKDGLGQKFEVDSSNEACARFNVKPGDRVIENRLNEKGTVIGVAGVDGGKGEERLYFRFDSEPDCECPTVTCRDPQDTIAFTVLQRP